MKRLVWSLVFVVPLTFSGACGSDSSSERSPDAAGGADTTTDATGAPGPEPESDVVSSGSCVSEYSAETLRERAFAFDGTVIEVRSETDPKGPADDPVTTRALIEVHRWFTGGSDDTALVWMQRDVAAGQRLLVTGEPRWDGEPLEDAIAWECGFTAEYSEAAAAEWDAALSGS